MEDKAVLPEAFWKWWNDLEKFGFLQPSSERTSIDGNDNEEQFWNTNVFRVKDPIVYLDPKDCEIDGDLCMVHKSRGKEYLLNGRWRKGFREGLGGISGPGLEEFGIRDIVGSYRRGKLQGPGKAFLTNGISLQGVFLNGQMEGYVRGFRENGEMCLVGLFKDGTPHGPFWKMLTGKAFMYGTLDRMGRFTGGRIFYLYPDISTSICGSFKDEELTKGHQCTLHGLELRNQLLIPTFTDCHGPEIKFSPSSLTAINCDPLQSDIFESSWVYVRRSDVSSECAGEGLFSKRRMGAGATVAFYNGIRVRPGETPPFRSYDYEIYVDWNKTSVSHCTYKYMTLHDIVHFFSSSKPFSHKKFEKRKTPKQIVLS